MGFPAAAPKRAVVLTVKRSRGTTFTARAVDGRPVLRGRLGARLPGWSRRYPYAYALDLSALRVPGRYTVAVGRATSPPFRVDDPAALYGPPAADATTFLRSRRDGAQVDASILGRLPSHLADQAAAVYAAPSYRGERLARPLRRTGGPVDVSGGWMDAGDTLKFAETASFSEVALLLALRDHQDALGAAAGPMRDEAIHGLSWLLRLWDPASGRLIYQVGLGTGDGRHVLGAHDTTWRTPEHDDGLRAAPGSPAHYVRFRPAFATAAPLSPNLAGRMAAAFALGAQVLGPTDPALAGSALDAARTIFARAATHWHGPLVTASPHAFYPEREWRDDLELGAAELALATTGAESGAHLDAAAHWAEAYGTSPLNGQDSLNLYDVGALAHRDVAAAIARTGAARVGRIDAAALADDLAGQQRLAAAPARRDPFGYAGAYRDADVVAHALGWTIESRIIDGLRGDGRLAAFGDAQRDLVLGENAWGTSFVVGAGTVFPHCLHDPLANLKGSLDGRGALLRGATVPGPTDAASLRGNPMPEGARRCPVSGRDTFRRFDGRGAGYRDTVASSPTVEPSIDLAALAVLAFGQAAGG